MWRHPSLILLIPFLCDLNATGQCSLTGDDTEKIITRCVTTQRIFLSEFYKLKTSDQNRVTEELISKFRDNANEQFQLCFIIDPPVYTRVPDCFQRLKDVGSIEIIVQFTLGHNSNTIEPTGRFQNVEEFIESVSQWENLHKLDFYNLGLTTCPSNLSKLSSLKTLSLTFNDLTTESFDELNLPSLDHLDISGNESLDDLPEGVLKCRKLRFLSIASCSFKNIPSTIRRLANLEGLGLELNPIKNFPHEIYSLKNLSILNMCHVKTLENAEIDFVLNPHLKCIRLWYSYSLRKVVLKIPEESLTINVFNMEGSPVNELIVSPNIAFSKIEYFSCNVPEHLPPSCGDHLGWPEVIELCESKILAVKYDILGKERALERSSLSECNKFCWNPRIFKSSVLDLGKDRLVRDELISLWKMVVERTGIDILNMQKFNYECSLLYLSNLYGDSVQDSSGSIKFTYIQYKPTMKSLLSALFRAINDSGLDLPTLKTHVEFILEMFQRPQGEQLVYFYYLLKTHSEGNISFEEFIQNSIAILKDYIFTMTANLKVCDRELLDECKTRAKNLGLMPDNEVINFINDGEYYEKQILPLFYYKFSPDWFCQIVDRILEFDKKLKWRAVGHLGGKVKHPTICFEYEDVEGSKFPVGIKVEFAMMKMGYIGIFGYFECDQDENDCLEGIN